MNTNFQRRIGLVLTLICALVWSSGWQMAQAAPYAPGDPVVNIFLVSSDSDDTDENDNAGGHCILEDATDATTLNTFSLTSDSNDTDEADNMSGVCIAAAAPEIDVTPTSHNYGQVQENTTSPVQAITIENLGSVDLTVSGIALSGTDPGQFTISGGGTCGTTPMTISAGNSCTVEVTFDPTSSGAKTATLELDSDDPDEGTVNLPLSGEGTATPVNVAVDVQTNTISPARQTDPISFTVTITNLDNNPLSSLPVDVVFPDAYLDCTTADHSPTVMDNQMTWPNLLGTAGVILSQNDPISFQVNCTAGLDTTLLPSQQATLRAIAANGSDVDGISIFAPTNVFIAKRGLDVDRTTGQVLITWQTADESQIAAFNVYRKWAGDKDWILLNSNAIVAERSGQATNGNYTFSDQLIEGAVMASAYRDAHYRLGLLMVDGSEQFLDLGSTDRTSAQSGAIYLPLMTK
ncbi:MAG: choice-of-anchor D domain-containing protein [Chloroflexota bacterium]